MIYQNLWPYIIYLFIYFPKQAGAICVPIYLSIYLYQIYLFIYVPKKAEAICVPRNK